MKTTFAPLTALLLLAVLAAGLCSAAPASAQEGVVADVNGQKITQAQLVAALMERFGYQMRETLIEQILVEQEAVRKGVTATDEEVSKLLEDVRAEINSRARMTGETFEIWMARQGLTLTSLRARLRQQLLLEKMVKPEVNVTYQELQEYYAARRQELARPEAMKVSHIAVATREEADQIRVKIAAGQLTWDDAARQHSLDPYGQDNGGLIGFIPRGEQPLQKAAFALQRDGEISQPFQDEMGWHLVRRDAYQAGGVPTFEEVEQDLRAMLTTARTAAAAQRRLGALMELADIKRLGDLKPPGQ